MWMGVTLGMHAGAGYNEDDVKLLDLQHITSSVVLQVTRFKHVFCKHRFTCRLVYAGG